jgi:hypothetical protein
MWLTKYANDAEFEAAYTSNDYNKARSLVEQAAKSKGFDVGPVYHGPRATNRFNEFRNKWSYFSSDRGVADRFRTETGYVLNIDGQEFPISNREAENLNPEPVEDADWATGWNLVNVEEGDNSSSIYAKRTLSNLRMMGYPYEGVSSVVMRKSDNPVMEVYLNLGKKRKSRDYFGEMWDADSNSIERELSDDLEGFEAHNIQEGGFTGNDGDEFPIATTYAVKSSGQIKSTEPFTFDKENRLIPLSKRFDQTNPDIRY